VTETMTPTPAPAPERKVKRHPIRGFLWGLVAGIGLSLILIDQAVVAIGTNGPMVVVLVMAVLGVLWSFFAPARGKG
jgi:hypothetical protein